MTLAAVPLPHACRARRVPRDAPGAPARAGPIPGPSATRARDVPRVGLLADVRLPVRAPSRRQRRRGQAAADTALRAHDPSLSLWATRRVPSVPRVELLEPLGLVPVRLASRHGLALPRLDETGRDPVRLPQGDARHHIDPGRFHGDRVNGAGDRPVPQGVPIEGQVSKTRTGSVSRSDGTAPTRAR
jgi:hypothetical protein